MNHLKSFIGVMIVSCILILSGCEKFLAEKTSKKLVVPEHLVDLQALMDNHSFTNAGGPSAGTISGDDYYLTDEAYDRLEAESDRRMYIWEKDYVFSNNGFNNWNNVYLNIYYSNTVIEGLEKIQKNKDNASTWDNIKGQALFNRGNSFLDGVSIWCLAYDASTATTDLGLPLRLNNNFNEVSKRANLQQTYDQLLLDLKQAVSLLPIVPLSNHRPCKAAAYGLIARTYLGMRNYVQANLYADSSLVLQSELLDFNSLLLTAANPIYPADNPEFLYARYMESSYVLITNTPLIPPEIYNLFAIGDLRKQAYFANNPDGTFYFKGSYLGNQGLSGGIATDEVLLIKAECLARAGDAKNSIDLVNKLLLKRWDKTIDYMPIVATDAIDAKRIVLLERRKELLMRGLRWGDIKRLNNEGANISLNRIVHGKSYVLSPNDVRFALPIPEDVISISGME